MKPETEYRGRIKAQLRFLNLTQEWLAGRLNVTTVTLSRKMNGAPFTEAEMRLIKKNLGFKTLEG